MIWLKNKMKKIISKIHNNKNKKFNNQSEYYEDE